MGEVDGAASLIAFLHFVYGVPDIAPVGQRSNTGGGGLHFETMGERVLPKRYMA